MQVLQEYVPLLTICLGRFSGGDSPASAGSLLDKGEAGVERGGQGAQGIPSKRNLIAPGAPQTFLLSNIQRLITPSGRTKSKFLSDQAQQKNALLVTVTETWLHNGVFDAEVSHDFPSYVLYRYDREGWQGGGVALYLRNNLTGEVIGSEDNGVCEVLVVHVHQLNTVVIVLYRPPDTRLSEFTPILSRLDSILSSLPDPTPNIVLMGDFNFQSKNLSWIRSDDGFLVPQVHTFKQGVAGDGHHVRQQAAKLCEVALKHNLIQQVDIATQGQEILDLVFSNNEDLMSSVSAEEWSCFTDHSIVSATVSHKLGKEIIVEENHLLKSSDRLKRLNVDWEPMLELAKKCPIFAQAWFMEAVIPILENSVPLQQLKNKGRFRWKERGISSGESFPRSKTKSGFPPLCKRSPS